MKIVVVIETTLNEPGVFLQGVELAEDLIQNANPSDIIEIVVNTQESLRYLANRGLGAHYIKVNMFDRLLRLVSASILFAFIQKKFKLVSHFEKSLKNIGTEFVIFATQSSTPSIISRTIFVSQIHDVAYLEYPEFPESGSFGESRIKRQYLEIVSRASALVITESPALRQSIIRRFDIDPQRVIAIPHSVPKDVTKSVGDEMADELKSFAIEDFFFYPAQFWYHKNHKVVVDAIRRLHEVSRMVHLVFAGKDHGSLEDVREYVRKLGLEKYVHFVGFQSRAELISLYKSCRALVMTTFFGPTNVPPLEAWSLGTPVVYSKHLSSDLGDSVIPVDVDSADSVANGLLLALDEANRKTLIINGRAMLSKLQSERKAQIQNLLFQMRTIRSRLVV
jgi:glycosyltransferase involved in cell wall biosynthesis